MEDETVIGKSLPANKKGNLDTKQASPDQKFSSSISILTAGDHTTAIMKRDLAKMKCQPCAGGAAPFRGAALQPFVAQLEDGWKIAGEHHLERTFLFPDFRQALDFTNRVGEVSETEQHHPEIYLTWGEVRLEVCTHKINGLTENDFILAAKLNALEHGKKTPAAKN